MSEFKVEFSVSPWLLLLIIPLFVIIFGVYFHTKKRFRRSRNRIISLLLHCFVSILSVLILSGIYFTYEFPNAENELVILVDASYSSTSYKDRVNDFVHEVLLANEGRSSVSIVTFGYDQRLVLPMGKHNPQRAYEKFIGAESPDITATDIASALTYIWDPANDLSGGGGEAIIHYPETAKILLISDGLETDRNALNVVKRISMDGVQVDATFYPSTYTDDVWITGVTYPDRSYSLGEEVEFELNLKSSYAGKVNISFTDSAEQEKTITKENALVVGPQTIKFSHSFDLPGHHELKFAITSDGDSLVLNNVYNLYFDIEEYVSILIIEKYDGESDKLVENLRSSMNEFVRITVANIDDENSIPNNINALSLYDEVVLVNIANGDMTPEFVDLLDAYVRVYGGGLFTVGGYERDENNKIITEKSSTGESIPRAHAYNEDDMKGTKFQELLPVDITEYTPPVALAIIIDRSGSMDTDYGSGSALDIAIAGAINSLEALSARDQVGVLTLEDNYHIGLDMTPMTQKQRIISTIRRVASGGGGGTSYAPAIEMAGTALCTLQNAQRKHILLLSDGQPSDKYSEYNSKMEHFYKTYGITVTLVSIGTEVSADLERFAENSGGHAYTMKGDTINTLANKVRADLGFSEEFFGSVLSEYSPKIQNHTTVVDGVSQNSLDEVTMGGFFTSVAKTFNNVQVPLMADYVPLYAQWTCGEGKVGSFMCDLEGYWSSEFLDSAPGTLILHKVVSNLISKVIVVGEEAFSLILIEDNYRTQVSVYGFNGHEETDSKLVAFVDAPDGETTKFDLSELSVSGNRFTFENRLSGVYQVVIAKVPTNFNVFADGIKSMSDISDSQLRGVLTAYRAFSYSKEYDAGLDSFESGRSLLIAMSTRKLDEGAPDSDKLVYDAESLLSYFADVHITYDPRLLFSALALVLLLLDIVVRKFQFKWLHEIIRTHKQRKTQFGE